MTRQKILEMRDLSITFHTSKGPIQNIRGVDLDLYAGETLAIVGESGSGKSVTVKTIMGIASSNQVIDSGTVIFNYNDGKQDKTVDLIQLSKKELRQHINGKRIAMVFQDPMTSLNPTMTIGNQIMEGMFIHYQTPRKEAEQKAIQLLDLVGITNPKERMKQYPHQLSGGMRQRVVIAIALACDPEILICDEPTTALDVTIQAKILDLIKDIQAKTGIAVIYITHDLGVVAKVADYVNVMYAGRIVEKGRAEEIFFDPRHPYTWGLLSAMPEVTTNAEKLYAIPGNPPNLSDYSGGDPFFERNDYALNIDRRLEAPMFPVPGSDSHFVASWLMHPDAPKVDMPILLKERIERMKGEVHAHDSQ
ncbi:TPA: ABC transporter ATP-binding protein [Streptococcus suis]